MWNQKKHRCMYMVAGLLTAVLIGGASRTASAAEKTTEQMLPTEGKMEFVTETVVKELPADREGTLSLYSVTSMLQQYEWDCYSSDYYYSKLSLTERLLYEQLDAVCTELMSSDMSAVSYEVTANDTGNVVKRKGTKMISCRGLTMDQVQKVQAIFCYANPQYYFLNNQLLTRKDDDGDINPDTCALSVYEEFSDGSKRRQATQQVATQLKRMQAKIETDGTVYEKYRGIHDVICEDIVYLKGNDLFTNSRDPFFTQSIYGALKNGETVCAGYTKLYSMLCNYFGLDCIAVTSKTHAWNQVRYGDHWYIVDVTWDDSTSSQNYFQITKQQMSETDQDASHVPNALYDGLLPETDTYFSDDLQVMHGLEQPQVTIKDTAAGVTIVMQSLQGDIYYTLDGTIPGTSDRYVEPIRLTTGGTYLVTAVTAKEGMLPSAYAIFPVRIAGGRVTITSVTNIKGKKIRVNYQATKSYAGYEVSYATKKDFSNQKSAKLTSKAAQISGLKTGKTYYIRVRGYKKDAYGNYYYTPYSKVKKVTVKQ